MSNWNDTDSPIAYLITFRTYGTWLPGDERGSIDKYHNRFGGPRAVSSIARNQIQAARLKSPPFYLSARARATVEISIKEVCGVKDWTLFALNVRTNHVHAVISGMASSERMLNQLKAYSTRRLREVSLWHHGHSPWSDKGSRRFIWTEAQIASASEYVANGQSGPLPDFD